MSTPKISHPSTPVKPFYQKAAKEQVQQYLKIAGGKSYLKSPFARALKEERSAYQHGQRDDLTKAELYALGKMEHGGTITKEKAKLIASAAVHMAREHEAEAGHLVSGLHSGTEKEAAKKIMRLERDQEPKPEAPKMETGPNVSQRIAAMQERLHIQHAPIRSQSLPTPIATEPTRLNPVVPAAPIEHHAATTRQAYETPTAPVQPPSTPPLRQMTESFAGGVGTIQHPDDSHTANNPGIPVLREASDTPIHDTDPVSSAAASSVQLPDTSHVDEGLPF